MSEYIYWFPLVTFFMTGAVALIWSSKDVLNLIIKSLYILLSLSALVVFAYNSGYIIKIG